MDLRFLKRKMKILTPHIFVDKFVSQTSVSTDMNPTADSLISKAQLTTLWTTIIFPVIVHYENKMVPDPALYFKF